MAFQILHTAKSPKKQQEQLENNSVEQKNEYAGPHIIYGNLPLRHKVMLILDSYYGHIVWCSHDELAGPQDRHWVIWDSNKAQSHLVPEPGTCTNVKMLSRAEKKQLRNCLNSDKCSHTELIKPPRTVEQGSRYKSWQHEIGTLVTVLTKATLSAEDKGDREISYLSFFEASSGTSGGSWSSEQSISPMAEVLISCEPEKESCCLA